MRGRVFIKRQQYAAQVDDLFPVELERGYGGAPCRCETEDFEVIITPGEMFGPAMFAWMKERREFGGQRVTCLDLGMFMIVAALTSEGEITLNGWAAAFARHYVFKSKGMRRITGLAQAVFASPVGARAHQTPERRAAEWFSHTQAPAG